MSAAAAAREGGVASARKRGSVSARKGGFTMITGASSGIGRELAFEFAQAGDGVCLVGRDLAALESARARCLELGAPEALAFAFDLAKPGEAERLLEAVAKTGREVSVLVHNAGFGVYGEFAKTPLAEEHRLVELQIQTVLTLTKGCLPAMLARKSGAILNIASVYSVSPVPNQAVYGASKAFLLSFAEGLATELEGTGVHVTTVCPGATRTEFRRRSGIHAKGEGASPAEIARFAYAAYANKRRIAVPGAVNRAFVRACRMLPMAWVSGTVALINRKRGLHP